MDLTQRLEKLYAGAVYDVLRDMGHDNCVLPPGIKALNPAHRLAGEVYTIDGHYELGKEADRTLRAWATLLSKAPGGTVLVCQPNTYDVALMGELSAQALMAKGVRGYVVDGASRDIEELLQNGFPTFCRFATPKDIVARWTAQSMGEPIDIGGVAIESGDYLLADRDGVVIIPQALAAEVVTRTEAKAETENAMREAIIAGRDPLEAYEEFGTF